jgi:hypothetical protein
MLIERFPNYQETRLIEKFKVINDEIRRRGVGIDMDSSEWMSEEVAVREFNTDHGTNYKISDLEKDRYAMVSWSNHIPGVNDPLQYAIRYWNNPEWLVKLKPCPGALIMSKYFSGDDVKIDLHRITARPGADEIVKATYDCYKRQMPWVDKSLIHIQRGTNTISSGYKVAEIDELNLGYFFEDAPDDAEAVVKKTNAIAIILPCYWNKGYKPDNPRILTFDYALENGLNGLGIHRIELQKLPRNVLAYTILADHILKNN